MQISNEYSFIHYAIPKTASQSSWRTFSKYVDVFGIDDCNSLIYHHAIPSEDLPEYKLVQSYGGKILEGLLVEGKSTSNIIKKLN